MALYTFFALTTHCPSIHLSLQVQQPISIEYDKVKSVLAVTRGATSLSSAPITVLGVTMSAKDFDQALKGNEILANPPFCNKYIWYLD